MSAQTALEEPTPLTDSTQYYEFAYEAVPGPTTTPPQINVIGPPSLTALVTDELADVELTLTQQGLPPDVVVYFDEKTPVVWHDYAEPDKPIPQPKWIVDFTPSTNLIQFKIVNPATSKAPVIVGFTPVILWQAQDIEPGQLVVPDPTIINIDPTGG